MALVCPALTERLEPGLDTKPLSAYLTYFQDSSSSSFRIVYHSINLKGAKIPFLQISTIIVTFEITPISYVYIERSALWINVILTKDILDIRRFLTAFFLSPYSL